MPLAAAPKFVAPWFVTVLKHAKLIKGTKKGRFVWYGLMPGVLEEAVEAGLPTDALNLGCCRLELPAADPAQTVC